MTPLKIFEHQLHFTFFPIPKTSIPYFHLIFVLFSVAFLLLGGRGVDVPPGNLRATPRHHKNLHQLQKNKLQFQNNIYFYPTTF